ncbi:MAG: lipoate--protein ligase family protein [Prevotella sp.]|nr:lipoate--protein ligase family protein [Prevotella sp.]
MKYVVLPADSVRRLSFYLAMEEYVARHVDEDDLFFMWQVRPTVIFGRNQVMENEVNVDYCREHAIEMYRRKSGGGCVYADEDNVMMSYVSKDENVGLTFNRFIGMLLLVLRRMGIEATGTTHNDVMIGDRKVSGTAFYHLPGRSIVHATMLYDTNMEHMLRAITPSEEKLQSKGIQSVRQRITLLKDHTTLSLEDFKHLVRTTLCEGELVLTPQQVDGIEQLEQDYLRREFIEHIKS